MEGDVYDNRPAWHAEAIVLRDTHGWAYRAIAEKFGVSLGAAHRAINKSLTSTGSPERRYKQYPQPETPEGYHKRPAWHVEAIKLYDTGDWTYGALAAHLGVSQSGLIRALTRSVTALNIPPKPLKKADPNYDRRKQAKWKARQVLKRRIAALQGTDGDGI